MKKILISSQTDSEILCSLEKNGYSPILLPPYNRLDKMTNCHADMLVCKLGRVLTTYAEYYFQNRALFNALDIEIYPSDMLPCSEYPHDIAMNALILDGCVFCRCEYTADKILSYAIENDLKICGVKQGYARCSCCAVSERAVITADVSIAKAAEAHGISILRISAGNIALNGCGYGFIGGASAVSDGRIMFFGDLSQYPDHGIIEKFADVYGLSCESLGSNGLYDYGGAVIL